jgi:hypothetical protein
MPARYWTAAAQVGIGDRVQLPGCTPGTVTHRHFDAGDHAYMLSVRLDDGIETFDILAPCESVCTLHI